MGLLKSKWFWIALIVVIPFIAVWIMEGIGWAVATLGILLFLILFIGANSRRRRKYYYDEDDEYNEVAEGDTHVYHHQMRRCPRCGGTGKVDPPPINRVFGIKWQCPKCGGNGRIWD